jgi:GNAT superfamily N-acetyltransferase
MTKTTTDRRDFRRAREMERGLFAAAAQRAEPHPLGLMLHDDRLPRVWVHNQLCVTGPAGDIDDLLGIVDEHYGHLPDSRVVVEDEVEGERLAEGFRARGWTVASTVYMVLREERDREPDATLAVDASEERHRDVERRITAEQQRAADPGLVEMLLEARAASHRVADECRYVVGVADGEDAGNTTVYVAGDVAQIEDVGTLEAFRGRGIARAMVSLAVDLALESGAEMVWIAADDADWPKELYGKLGFRPVGRTFSFTRQS